MKNIIWIIILLLISNNGYAQESQLADLTEAMTEQEFIQNGLSKLSSEELKSLETWLTRKEQTSQIATTNDKTVTPVVTEDASNDNRFGLGKKKTTSPESQLARIDGTFKGWSGATVFQLDNGQIWKQRIRGNWKTTSQNPEIEIYRTKLGYYYLRILSNGKKVGVRRVE